MEARKLEEIEFHNQREMDRHNLSDEEYEKKYSNKKFYSYWVLEESEIHVIV